ncbi:hypothetical protein BDP27DRAFT_438200 [Rhodocollybia butyracea]|uniref:Nephrocystin 3-like N-terminal domain-containing protein n=1 Tax=Rhodocollybia butyracea TaxID=206335 RepID=A0A9P5PD32_9AGAR|nr:hypothetical protein BDP27DRAFT_438200 [Rhodocollybia butyracea]
MSTPLNPKLDLSKLVFKIEAIKLKLDNPPKSGKISVTLQAKKDNVAPDEKGGVAKSGRQKVNHEMQWQMNTNISFVDAQGIITVDVEEHHKVRKSKSLVSSPFSLKNEDIFNNFVKSGVTGDTQEFTLTGADLTIILSISGYSLDHVLKTFSPPTSIVSKLGKYQAGLDLILQLASAVGGLNAAAGVAISAATQAFEFLKKQEKCHQDILNLFEHMGGMLTIITIEDVDSLKKHSKMIEEVIDSILNCIKGAVEQVLVKCQENMLKQLVFSSDLSGKISDFRNKFDDLKEQYRDVLAQVTASIALSIKHDRILTEKLKPQSHEGYKVCMEDTRVALLSKLTGNIKRSSIVWLHGLAGTGKSSIAGSLEQKFREKPVDPDLTGIELAIGFHCTRGTRSEDLHILVPTLAYNIARKFPAFGRHLADDPQLSTSGGLHYQFKNLLHQPLDLLKNEKVESPTSQILVIIDALDEWADEEAVNCF